MPQAAAAAHAPTKSSTIDGDRPSAAPDKNIFNTHTQSASHTRRQYSHSTVAPRTAPHGPTVTPRAPRLGLDKNRMLAAPLSPREARLSHRHRCAPQASIACTQIPWFSSWHEGSFVPAHGGCPVNATQFSTLTVTTRARQGRSCLIERGALHHWSLKGQFSRM